MRNYENIKFFLKAIRLGEVYYDRASSQFYRNGRLMKQFKNGKGKYLYIEAQKNGTRYRTSVHCLLFALYRGINELMKHETIDHINGDKYDNRIENLQGLSRFENSQKDSNGKLSPEDAKMIKFLLEEGFANASIARVFEVSPTTISKIKNGKRFNWL